MINKNMAAGRLGLLLLFPATLTGCSMSPEAVDLSQHINSLELEEVNLAGNHTVFIRTQGGMAGRAQMLSKLCSIHLYPYDFAEEFNTVVETASDKAFENVNIQYSETLPEPPAPGQITIDMAQETIGIMCYHTTSFSGECRVITRMNGVIRQGGAENEVREQNISIEGNKSNGAGGFCEGVPGAMSSSIGTALNDFGKQLHGLLIAD